MGDMQAERRRVTVALAAAIGAVPACSVAPGYGSVRKVGYQPFGAPISFLPGAGVNTFRSMDGNRAEGVMIDLHRVIAADAGYRVEFVPYLTGEMDAAITARQLDIRLVVSSRLKLASEIVSDAIYRDHEVLLAHADDPTPYATHDDLRGLIVGSRTGTVSERDVVASGLTHRSYAAVPELLQAIGEGEVKVAINTTYLITSQILAKGGYPKVKIVKGYRPRLSTVFGIGVRSDAPDLLASMNESLRRRKKDGSVRAIFAKYGVAEVLV